MTKCCIIGCKKDLRPQHRFPRDNKKCLKWIKAAGRPEFLTLDRDRLCTGYLICDVHFSDKWKIVPFNSKSNLLDNAVPELYLPEPLDIESEDTNHVTINKEFVQQSEEHNYCKPIACSFQDSSNFIDKFTINSAGLKAKPSSDCKPAISGSFQDSSNFIDKFTINSAGLKAKPTSDCKPAISGSFQDSSNFIDKFTINSAGLKAKPTSNCKPAISDIPNFENVILTQNNEEDFTSNSNMLIYSIQSALNSSSLSPLKKNTEQEENSIRESSQSVQILNQLNSTDADFQVSDVNNSKVKIIAEGSLCGHALNILKPDELEATSIKTLPCNLGKKQNLKRRNNVIFKKKDLTGNLALRVLKADQLPVTSFNSVGPLHLTSAQYLNAMKNKRKRMKKLKKSKVVCTTMVDSISNPDSGRFQEENIEDNTILPSTSKGQDNLREFENSSISSLDTKRLLKLCKVSRKNQLSPAALKLYEATNVLKKKLSRLMIYIERNKQKVKEATEYRNYFENFYGNSATANFLMSQLRHHHVSPGGRRFSFDDKIYALSLIKLNHQGYNLLQNTFALPSKSTAKSLLNNINISCGINEKVMNALKQAVEGMSVKDRNCVLMFKEMPLEATLTYNSKFDRIDGLKHIGATKENRYADHAIVFIAKGLSRPWKQPVAFFFSELQMSSCDLAENIKDIVIALRGVGLQVVATVCTEILVNVNAITVLENASQIHFLENGLLRKAEGFTIGDDEKPIIPLYDVPHLLKRLRNHLLNNDLKFVMEGQNLFASWHDIIQFYEVDQSNENPLCYKLSGKHIYKKKIDMSSINIAAQLFSHRVSTTMGYAANIPGNNLSRTATGTAKFIGFINNLFDSLNCLSLQYEEWAPLKGCVTAKSPHVAFWKEAITILSTVRFDSYNNKDLVAPTVTNWIKTVTGFDLIWKTLQKREIKQLPCASLNLQDIENFFESMRKKTERDSCPTPNAFISSYKNMLINNLMSPDSPGSNGVEKTEQETMLSILKELLEEEPKDAQEIELLQESLPYIELTDKSIKPYKDDIEKVIEELIEAVKGCAKCKESLVPVSESHQSLMKLLLNAFNITNSLLPNICNQEHIMQKICIFCKDNLSLIETCENHDLFNIAIEACVEKQILSWISKVNDLLNSEQGYSETNPQIVLKSAKKNTK